MKKRTRESQLINSSRIEVQRHRHELVDQLEQSVLVNMGSYVKHEASYTQFLQDIITEGLLRLLENKIKIRCRPEDEAKINKVKDDAIKNFRKT